MGTRDALNRSLTQHRSADRQGIDGVNVVGRQRLAGAGRTRPRSASARSGMDVRAAWAGVVSPTALDWASVNACPALGTSNTRWRSSKVTVAHFARSAASWAALASSAALPGKLP